MKNSLGVGIWGGGQEFGITLMIGINIQCIDCNCINKEVKMQLTSVTVDFHLFKDEKLVCKFEP